MICDLRELNDLQNFVLISQLSLIHYIATISQHAVVDCCNLITEKQFVCVISIQNS